MNALGLGTDEAFLITVLIAAHIFNSSILGGLNFSAIRSGIGMGVGYGDAIRLTALLIPNSKTTSEEPRKYKFKYRLDVSEKGV